MAMLAEQRSKQKWSDDPRNMKWSTDKERYGYQMLEKMGWADGKGLGKKQSGKSSHVKIKKRKQNLGLGAKESHDNDWLAQQEDFNNLLSALQQHSGNAELQSEEQNKKAMLEVAKASRKRVFYKKFIRSKDTSQYSQKDMACIFGSQSVPATPLNQSDDESRSEDSTTSCPTIPCNPSSEFVTYTSKQNIQEYFAHRMMELRNSKGKDGIEKDNGGDKGIHPDEEQNTEIEKEDPVDCAQIKSRKNKKRKRSKEMKDKSNEEETVSINLCGEKQDYRVEMKEKSPKNSNNKSKRSKIEETDESIMSTFCDETNVAFEENKVKRKKNTAKTDKNNIKINTTEKNCSKPDKNLQNGHVDITLSVKKIKPKTNKKRSKTDKVKDHQGLSDNLTTKGSAVSKQEVRLCDVNDERCERVKKLKAKKRKRSQKSKDVEQV